MEEEKRVPKETSRRREGVQAVKRAITILKTLGEEEMELGVSELARRSGLQKSTVHRLLQTLQREGLVEQNPETGKYRLGLEILRLAGTVLRELEDLQQVARPFLRALAEECGETVNLTILAGDGVINVDRIPSPHRVRNIGWIGRKMPLHCVSAGKVFLAYMPEEEVERFLNSKLPRLTKYTITDPAKLREELQRVRELGYGVGLEELEEGLNAVAAPIRDYRGKVVAAISVSGPSFRLTREKIPEVAELTKRAADEVSRHLGYVPEQERSLFPITE
ncbi:MAG: IclR family transcriptional regulator [Chloroflexi bacterium]|nr:MAG: IclR family transcriptional regulator [Chloroflexota bacterium]